MGLFNDCGLAIIGAVAAWVADVMEKEQSLSPQPPVPSPRMMASTAYENV
jgi:hypothetical protein